MRKHKSIGCLFFSLLLSHFLYAQNPMTIKRISKLDVVLKKKEPPAIFKFVLDSTDVLMIKGTSSRWTNLRLKAPTGAVIYESRMRSIPVFLQKDIELAGEYEIEVENTNKYLCAKSMLEVELERNPFQYGDTLMIDSLKSEREELTILNSDFQITKTNDREYNVEVSKGDTLKIALKPLSRKTPFVQLKNNLEETLWSTVPQKDKEEVVMPVLTDGTYTLSMSSRAFFAKTNELLIERIVPVKYAAPTIVEEPDTSQVTEEIILYDTVPELLLDTTIFLGAGRDIIHERQRKLPIQFGDTTNIVFWCVFFSTKRAFDSNAKTYEPLFSTEKYLSAGVTDIISAYGLGLLDVLPKSEMDQVSFSVSKTIRPFLDPINGNYAIIPSTIGNHFIAFNNQSLSSGQHVFARVVIFRKTPK